MLPIHSKKQYSYILTETDKSQTSTIRVWHDFHQRNLALSSTKALVNLKTKPLTVKKS
jgi:hypothetical protein